MVNVVNINRVADAIEKAAQKEAKPALGFNMGYEIAFEGCMHYPWVPINETTDRTGHGCQTVACVAGWVHAVIGRKTPKQIDKMGWEVLFGTAQALLGITMGQRQDLFFASNGPAPMSMITPEQAVDTLRRLARTGEVTW